MCPSSTIMVDKSIVERILKCAYELIEQPLSLIVDSILDIMRQSQIMRVVDQPPMAVVNHLGVPRMVLPTLVRFLALYAYRDNGLRLM